MTAILAQIAGGSIVRLLIYLMVFGLIFWLLWWLLQQIDPPQPWRKVAEVILAVGAVIVIINALLSLVGQPFIVF